MSLAVISAPQARAPRWLNALAATLFGKRPTAGASRPTCRGARAVWRAF